MDTLEKEIDKYLSDVRKFIICDKKKKDYLVQQIEESVYEFADRNGISDISEIYEKFGTPEELAHEHLGEVEPKKVLNAMYLKRVLIGTVATIIVLLATALILSFFDAHNSYYTDRDFTLTYEPTTKCQDIIK